MAKHRKSRKSRKAARRGGKPVTLGGRKFACAAKRVRAFGRKQKVTRAYCHKASAK